MTVDQHELYVGSEQALPDRGTLRRFLTELAPQDVVVFTYLVVLNAAVLSSPPGKVRVHCLAAVAGFLALHVSTVVAVRSSWLTHRYLKPLLYRVVTFSCVQLTYFTFAELLPLVNPRSLDTTLYHLDLAIFGVEPAVYLDRFVNSFTTEWFAFFYFSYFLVLAIHVLPILFFTRRTQLLAEFAMGILLLFCIGHTLYMLVPGFGPYKAMPEVFHHELSHGVWWNTTKTLVARDGAQKDIFPSLHTAAPAFMVLFAFHRRGEFPFRYTWPLVAFFGANIVIATMFLRWHYVIDVIVGLLLALVAHTLAVFLMSREATRRESVGLGTSWPEWP